MFETRVEETYVLLRLLNRIADIALFGFELKIYISTNDVYSRHTLESTFVQATRVYRPNITVIQLI